MAASAKQVGFVLAALMLIILAFSRLEMRIDISDFLFSENNPDSAFVANQFQADALQRKIVLSLQHKSIATERVLEFIDQFQRRLSEIQGVERVWSSPLDEEGIKSLMDAYSDYQIQLRSLNPEQDIANLFGHDALQQRVQQIRTMLLGPDPMWVKKRLHNDPMLLTLDWLRGIQARYQQSTGLPGFSILFLKTAASGMNTDAQTVIQQKIETVFESLNTRYAQKFSLELTGVPVFSVKIKKAISDDVMRVSVLSMLVILLIFLLVFRSLKALLLTAFLLLTTVSGAILVTQLIFGFVHGLTLALGATLMGISIDYFIHVMMHGRPVGNQISDGLVRKIWPSLMLGGATTLTGYLALAASGFPGLQQIAVFSSSGIVIALLMSRYLLPILMVGLDLHLQPRLGSDRLLCLLNTHWLRWSLISLVMVIFAVGMSGIKWSDNLDMLSPELEQLKHQDRAIRSRFSSIEPGRFLITSGAGIEMALQRNEALQAILDPLHQDGGLDQYYPVYPWIASKQLQARNVLAWNTALEENANQAWSDALEQGGFSTKNFPALPGADKAYIGLDAIKKTAAWTLFSAQYLQQDEQVLILTWLGGHDVKKIRQAVSSVPGVRYFSQKDSMSALAQSYRQKASWMLMWGLLAIFALLMWRFRSPLQAVKVLSPALLAILGVLGGWGLSGHSMNMLHLVGLLLAAAICVDYGILLFENRAANRSLSFGAITASALTSAASFACLGVAQNPALQALAWTVAPGIIIGYLLCPAILQPMNLKSLKITG